VVSFAWDRTIGFFANIGLAPPASFAAVMAVLLIILRRFLQRRRTEGTDDRALASSPASRRWRPRRRGRLVRVRSERSSASRARARRGEPWSAEVADALARYAELRYGGIGEEHAVAQHLEELARKVTP